MADFPAELSTGMVHGRFIVAVIDGEDEGQEPDVVPAQGKVAFKASVGYIPVPVATGGPVTVMKGPIMGVLDDEGYLCTPHPATGEPMYRGVRLISTDDPDMAVTDWTWSADYRLEAVNGNSMQIPAHSFALPSGAEVDLTTLVKVPSSPGYGLPQAEAAVNETITGAVVVGDDLQMTRRNGDTFIAGNVRGAQGLQGIQGVQGPAGISNADQFYTVSETAGRTVTIWDYLNNREQLIYGDTGWRDVSSWIVPDRGYTVSLLQVRRVGGTVHIRFADATGGTGTFFTPTAGFRVGSNTNLFWVPVVSNAGVVKQLRGNNYGFIVNGVAASDVFNCYAVYETSEPWPTALPGVAA